MPEGFSMPRLLLCLAAIAVTCGNLHAENWPQFRGPTGQGVSSETNLPLSWSGTDNIAWKTEIPGEGWSSPVVFDDRVYVTSTLNEGTECRVICLDRMAGKIAWNTPVGTQVTKKKRRENSYATPTPIVDGKRVYAVFGSGLIAGLNIDGKLLWTNREVEFYSHHGLGSSPTLFENLLIMPFDGSDEAEAKVGWKIPWDKAVILALDGATGKVAWRGRRGLSRISHLTPVVYGSGDSAQLVSNAGDAVQGFNPRTGERLWSVYSKGEGVTPSLVAADGLVITSSGFEDPTLRAIRPDGQGDVTKTHIQWEQKKGVPLLASMVYVKPHLYTLTREGVVTCFTAASGEILWQERIGGLHWSSPVYADGHIYWLDETGVTTVIKTGTEFKLVATNPIGEKCQATYAVSQGQIFIRGEKHLFCVGK